MCNARMVTARQILEEHISVYDNAEGLCPYQPVYELVSNEFERLALAEVVEQRSPDFKTVLVNGTLYIVPKHFVRGEDY